MNRPRAAATQTAAISQKRMITVVSGQPSSSKWWWIGDMRNSRRVRPLALNTPICRATEPASITLRPQISSEQQLRVHRQREQRERRAEAERADVAHDDPRRRGVEPQEAHARAGERGGQRGEVERVDDGAVDVRVPERPVADDHERAEAHQRRAAGEAVEAVGDVDGVRRRPDDQPGEDHPDRPSAAPSPGSRRGSARSSSRCRCAATSHQAMPKLTAS